MIIDEKKLYIHICVCTYVLFLKLHLQWYINIINEKCTLETLICYIKHSSLHHTLRKCQLLLDQSGEMCSYISHQHVRKRFPTCVFLASLYCKIDFKSRNTNAFEYRVLNLSPREGEGSLSHILTTEFIQFCTSFYVEFWTVTRFFCSPESIHSCISPVINCSASYSFG